MGTPRPPLAPPRRSTPWALVFFLGLIAALGVFAALSHFGDPGSPQEAAAPAPPPPPPIAKAPPAPSPSPAPAPAPAPAAPLDAVAKARAFVKDHPTDLTGQQDAWRRALLETDGRPGNEEARKEFDALREIHKIALEVQLKELDARTKELSAKEDFRAALAELETARKRHGLSDWAQAVDLRVRDLNAGVWKAFTPVRDRALDAKRRKADAEVAPHRDRVATWGLESFVKELDRALAAVGTAADVAPPPPPPPVEAPASAGLTAWRAAWEKAIEPAQVRDYAAAKAALEKAAAAAPADAAAEAKEDLEILKAVEAAERAARRRLASWPRGERVALIVVNDEGRLERLEEPFLQAADGDVELMRGSGTAILEGADVAARGLGDLYRGRPGATEAADRRVAALLCLFEGDVDGARTHLNGPPDQIPWKYWSLGSRIGETATSAREATARKLYFAAAREHVSPRTRAASIAKYRTLLNEHADARIVSTRRARIVARRDAAKETVFLAEDIEAAGTFKASRHPKTGPCWLSTSDSPPAKSVSNFVEFSFYALPDAQYRCWAYVAACCAETFAFWTQSTDLTVQDPETKSAVQAEPGGGAAAPVKHAITFLKPRHESHGGPKEPKRWEWVQIPLPKYTAGGVKTVRLLTDQKGFAVGLAVASAARSGPPLESELKAWLKSRADEALEAPEAAPADPETRHPAMVAWWKLDEAGGATALDASGSDHTGVLVGDPERGPGKFGNALNFDGREQHVVIPNSAALDRLSEDGYTIAAWYRPETRPAGAQPTANDAYHAIVMKTGLHEGLKYGSDLKFAMDHWLADGSGAAAVSGATWPPGTFYHVAGVVSRTEGSVRLYVNGRLEGTNTWSPKAAPKDFGRATWKLGIAAPGAAEMRWAAHGAIDDVRLYHRALNQAEIRALAGGGSASSAPAIALSSPGPGETFEPGSTIGLDAVVTGVDKVQRVDFLLGGTVIGTDASAPWTATWARVPAGLYTITARALIDKGSPPLISRPVTVRVGEVSLYRAINLGGTEKAAVEGTAYEPGSGAPNLAVNAERTEHRELEFHPAADGGRPVLLRTALSYRDGTVATVQRVPNGTYQVFLWVLEDDESETIDLLLEDKPVQTKYATGPKGSWAKLGPFTIDLLDGALKIGVKGGAVNLAAVEVWKVSR